MAKRQKFWKDGFFFRLVTCWSSMVISMMKYGLAIEITNNIARRSKGDDGWKA
jgi:ATP/ADP translocase